jgi:hypothetical protein
MPRRSVVVAVQAVFVTVFVALAVSNLSLRRQLDAERRTRFARQSRFFEGDTIPSFEARDRAQRPFELSGDRQAGRVVVMFIPGCDACEQVLDEIARKPSSNVTVVSLMSQREAALSAKKLTSAVPFYFVDDIHLSTLRSRARVVPQILRVGPDGRVAEVCQTYAACIQHLGQQRSIPRPPA